MEAPVSRPFPCLPSRSWCSCWAAVLRRARDHRRLPAFGALGREFDVPQDTVQLTLGVYMFCYAAMLLLHGTLSDSLGRRRVVLTALVCYVAGALLAAARTSAGCWRRARCRACRPAPASWWPGHRARLLRGRGGAPRHVYLILVFNLSPALAPIIGG